MIGFINLKTTGWNITKKQLRQPMVEAFFAMPTHWHKEFAEKHFTKQGAREYDYVPRIGERGGANFKRSYTGRKKAKFGHTLPLVFTGKSKERILERRDIRANTKRGKAVLNAPTLNFRPAKGRINLFQEMTRVSGDELKEITGVGHATLSDEINKIRFKENRKIA